MPERISARARPSAGLFAMLLPDSPWSTSIAASSQLVSSMLGDQLGDPHTAVTVAPPASDLEVHQVLNVPEADGLAHQAIRRANASGHNSPSITMLIGTIHSRSASRRLLGRSPRAKTKDMIAITT